MPADIVPVLEGLAQPSTAQRLPYGCQQLTQQLGRLLAGSNGDRSGSNGGTASFASSAALDGLARSIVRVAGSAEEAASAAVEPVTHTLPDGQTITVQRQGLQLGEALMDGSQLGLDVPRLSQAVYTAATAQAEGPARKVRPAGNGRCCCWSCWFFC